MINILIIAAIVSLVFLSILKIYKTYKKAISTGNPNCLGCSGNCHNSGCGCNPEKK